MDSSRFYSLLAALLFTAVCAWIGAAVFAGLQAPETALPNRSDPGTPAELRGIVLRREESVSPDAGRDAYPDGQRLSAGENPFGGGSVLFFADCDGYEYLRPERAQALCPETLDALLNAGADPSGADSARIVLGCDWYYAAFVSRGDIPAEGEVCRLLFDHFPSPVRALLLSARSDSSGRTALLFRLTEGGDYLKLRFSDAVIVG